MDLTTSYLGLKLANPFVSGASPLADDLDVALRLEDAGAAAIVLPSLFEEQIVAERRGLSHLQTYAEGAAEAQSFFPDPGDFPLGPDRYLEHLTKLKQRVGIPVIASLNGTTSEGWLEYAKLLDRSGADALELNFYHVATDLHETGPAVEHRVIDIVAVLKESINIPLAVKLSPFYSALPNLAWQLDRLGAAGLVLFNRFYQPDIDPEGLEAVPRLELSDPSELLLRLRWTAILFGRIKASIALSGGVHEPLDAVRAVMAGADTVQIVSALLQHGPDRLTYIRREFERWAEEHDYSSVGRMRGCMSLLNCPDPTAFERGNYVKTLLSWRSKGTAPLK
jgi:dihydroorotate dehydrogenase (fumarate)